MGNGTRSLGLLESWGCGLEFFCERWGQILAGLPALETISTLGQWGAQEHRAHG